MGAEEGGPARLEGDGITHRGWAVRCAQGGIASSGTEAALGAELGITLPGMLFSDGYLECVCEGAELSFRAVDALRGVQGVDPAVKVRAAAAWSERRRREGIAEVEGGSDWTFTTRYGGDLRIGGHLAVAGGGSLGVDYEELRRVDIPILFASEVVLFEDELDDNGTASYKVRIRVMGGFFFILARFFLRVDGVLLRVLDTRWFHRFGSGVLVKESSTREADLATALKDVHPSVLQNPDLAAQRAPLVQSSVENFAVALPQ